MKIGLDLSVIQTPHRMRGIGATTINFVKHLPAQAKREHTFALFLYEQGQLEALQILDLQGINYEIRTLEKQERVKLNLPGKLKKLNGVLNSMQSIINRHKSDPRIRIEALMDLDAYLQFDQMQAPPKKKGLKTIVILYDLIPYIMESDYLWNYRTGRRNGDSRKSSLRKALLRRQYMAEVKAVCKQASTLIAISNHTKNDFVKFAGVAEKKIHVVHLGIEPNASMNVRKNIEIHQYLENSWSYTKTPIDLTKKPYVLFIGGADPRRKLVDLVAAYNNLKARGHDIRLVLAGDIMKGPAAIPVVEVRKYLMQSSYPEDIIFLGFVTDDIRDWLYKHALAFVYPSVYEGFGLPVLEAMQYGTPVITYRNSSIEEISGDAGIYADNFLSIQRILAHMILVDKKSLTEKYQKLGQSQAKKFSWSKSVEKMFLCITD